MDPFALSHNDFVDRYQFTLEREDQRYCGPKEVFSRAMRDLRPLVNATGTTASVALRRKTLRAVMTDAWLRSRRCQVIASIARDASMEAFLSIRSPE